jgi:hypothetical protein
MKDYDVLKTFLLYLNYMPEKILCISEDIHSVNINIDENITKITGTYEIF